MAEASVYTILAALAAVVRCTSMNLPRVGVNPLSYPLSERRPGLYALNETRCRDFVSPRNARKDYPAVRTADEYGNLTAFCVATFEPLSLQLT